VSLLVIVINTRSFRGCKILPKVLKRDEKMDCHSRVEFQWHKAMSPQHNSLLRALTYQFDAMGLPKSLHKSAVDKIIRSEMDAGLYVTFVERDEVGGGSEDGANMEETEEEHEEEGEEQEKGEGEGEGEEEEDDEGIPMHHRTRYNLCVCREELKSESVVLLIDHMWTTNFPQSREHLQCNPGLAERIPNPYVVNQEWLSL